MGGGLWVGGAEGAQVGGGGLWVGGVRAGRWAWLVVGGAGGLGRC